MYFVYKGNTKENRMSIDSDEARTRKGSGGKIHIFLVLAETFLCFFQCFIYIIPNMRNQRYGSISQSAYLNRGNQWCIENCMYMCRCDEPRTRWVYEEKLYKISSPPKPCFYVVFLWIFKYN